LKNILVIDDDVHIGNTLEETLVNEEYRVSCAYSGTETVFVLSQAKPDLVLLDLMLPGLSGEEVLPHIKGIPVMCKNSSSFCSLEEKSGKIAANAEFTGFFKEICSVKCCTILRKNMKFKKWLVTRLVTYLLFRNLDFIYFSA